MPASICSSFLFASAALFAAFPRCPWSRSGVRFSVYNASSRIFHPGPVAGVGAGVGEDELLAGGGVPVGALRDYREPGVLRRGIAEEAGIDALAFGQDPASKRGGWDG